MIAITLLTYKPEGELGEARQRYAEDTLAALFKHIRTKDDLWLAIADDGSAPEYREHLWELAGKYVGSNRSITNSERRGYGGNYNLSTQVTHNLAGLTALLPLEDDWKLERTLDLDPLVRVLQTEPAIGCIRLGYVGYIPGQSLRGTFLWAEDQHFLVLDPYSESQYVFSGHPRLESVEWARSVGPWPEGLPAGETELAVSGRLDARYRVAWPLDLIPPKGGLFSHIGTHQAKNEPLKALV